MKKYATRVGFSGTIKDVSYSLSYNYNKSPGMSKSDEIYALNLSLPLSLWLRPQNDVSQKHNYAYATYNISTDKRVKPRKMPGSTAHCLRITT